MKDIIVKKVKHQRYHYIKVDNMEEFKYQFRIGEGHSFLKDEINNAVAIFKKHSYTDWKNIKEGDIVTVKDEYIYDKPSRDGYIHTNKNKVGKFKVTSLKFHEAKFYRPTMSGVKLKLAVRNIETGMSNVLEMHEIKRS